MTFQIKALNDKDFSHLWSMTESALREANAERVLVDESPCYPCRISLEDAAVGEEVLLVNYQHQPADSPYRSSHGIFLRPGQKQATVEPGTVPYSIRSRMISVRGFSETHHIIQADLATGDEIKKVIARMFDIGEVAYIHLHNAKPGCYAASVTRV